MEYVMIKIKGDLLALAKNGEFDIIVQGCNCFCTMGSGIARQIREQYPIAFSKDQETTVGDYNKLGNYTLAQTDTFAIVNAYTQYKFNSNGERADLFEYVSFAMILQKLAHYYGHLRFGFPMIGMGLAGGNEVKILGLLSDFDAKITAQGGTVTLVEFAPQ